jgi:Fic family protein
LLLRSLCVRRFNKQVLNNKLSMATELEILQNISDKLNQLIILTRLANSKAIADFKKEIEDDPVFQAVLDTANASLSSDELKEKVKEQTNVSKGTIKNRIAELMEKGGLTAVKKGKEIYYDDSGLYR